MFDPLQIPDPLLRELIKRGPQPSLVVWLNPPYSPNAVALAQHALHAQHWCSFSLVERDAVSIPEYEYAVAQCDVPSVRRASLTEYGEFRRKCLDYIRGDSETSVANQIHSLVWHTAVFRSLNEARRIEPDRPVNGPMWS